MTVQEHKQALRAQMLPLILSLSPEERARQSALLQEQLVQLPAFRDAHIVMLFYPIKNEPDLRPLMELHKEDKIILLPVSHETDIEMRRYTGVESLSKGRFGIMEPQGPTFSQEPDLIIIPGIAFDKKGHRLGRGRGYYDRFLRQWPNALRYAVGYEFQLLEEEVPVDEFDTPFHAVVTPLASYLL